MGNVLMGETEGLDEILTSLLGHMDVMAPGAGGVIAEIMAPIRAARLDAEEAAKAAKVEAESAYADNPKFGSF